MIDLTMTNLPSKLELLTKLGNDAEGISPAAQFTGEPILCVSYA